MKLIHLSDLHLGKRIYEYSMLEEQDFILQQILQIVDAEQPDGLILAGDIYDKPIPPAEAVQLFDAFLVQLAERKLEVYVISGNHDSPERIAFGARLMDGSGIHLSPVYCGEVVPFSWEDEFGTVRIFLLPFLKPAQVRRYFGDGISSYTEAVSAAISNMEIDPDERNVLVTHQFVTGAARTESEEILVGGSENIDASVFAPFDYVALGHLHAPQQCGAQHIRYCGTPLKYSFSEKDHKKTITVLDIGNKKNGDYADIAITEIPLNPIRDMREIRGRYNDIMNRENYVNTNTEDYLHIVLTDEEDVPEGISRLRSVYPNIMLLDYDNERTRHSPELREIAKIHRKSRMELLEDLYKMMNGKDMSNEQREFAQSIFDEICNVNQEEK